MLLFRTILIEQHGELKKFAKSTIMILRNVTLATKGFADLQN